MPLDGAAFANIVSQSLLTKGFLSLENITRISKSSRYEEVDKLVSFARGLA